MHRPPLNRRRRTVPARRFCSTEARVWDPGPPSSIGHPRASSGDVGRTSHAARRRTTQTVTVMRSTDSAQQPAALDPLERPEPAGRLVGGQLRESVLGEVLPHRDGLRNSAFPKELAWCALEDLVERGLAGRPAALGKPLLAYHPRRIGNGQLARERPALRSAGARTPPVAKASPV